MSAIAFPYVLYRYVLWHYTRALSEIVVVFRNVVWFLWNFFSIGLLADTLFSPWRRIRERQPEDVDLETIGEIIVANILMRVVGIGVRFFFIVFGCLCILLCFLTLILSLVVWMLLPLIIISLITVGATALFALS